MPVSNFIPEVSPKADPEYRALVASARKILDTAKAEKRDMTSEESRQFDEFLAKAEEVGNRHQPRKTGPDPIGEDREESPGELRAIKPNESYRDELRRLGVITERAGPRLSLGRTIRGIVTGEWDGASAERRALSGLSDTGGGYLIPPELSSEMVDLARARSVCLRAGARTMPMKSSSLTMARLTADPSPSWRVEGSVVASSDPAFGALTMTARSLGVIVPVSRELLADAPNAGSALDAAISAALALELDRACLDGDGVTKPRGVRQDPDVLTFNAGAIADWGDLADAVGRIRTQNEEPTVCVCHPRTASSMDRFQDSTFQPLMKPDSVKSLTFLTTTSLPTDLGDGTNEAPVVVGDFTQMVIGVRQNLEIEISRDGQDANGRGFQRNEILIRAILRADSALLRPKAFCWLSGVTN